MTEHPAFYAGIDPSITNTGLVIIDSQGVIIEKVDGSDIYQNNKFDGIDRYIAQAEYITGYLNRYSVSRIAYEDYAYSAVHKAYSLAEYGGILKAAIYRSCGLEPFLVAPKKLKKFASGNGSATKMIMKKQAMLEGVSQDTSYDICDAFFLAKYMLYLSDTVAARKMDAHNPKLRSRLELILKQANNVEENNV